MTKFFRIIKFAFQNLGRNLWLTLMTVVVLSVTLFSVNVLLSLNVLAKVAATALESKIDVSVYVKPTATDDEKNGLRSYLTSLPQVSDVQSVSPDEALSRFRERHKGEPELLKALDEVGSNPLGATFVVRARQIGEYPAIISALDHPAYRDLISEKNFDDYTSLISRVQALQNKLSGFGIALLALFAFIAMIIMVNVVRVAIFTHKEEIAIMKLVGASGMFIRGPYLVESILLSLIALVIASAAIFGAAYAGTPYLQKFLDVDPGLISFFVHNATLIIGGEFVALVGLTGTASAYAVGRYMKV